MKNKTSHFTPGDLAAHLETLVPSGVKTVLDPSAGVGDLIRPLTLRQGTSAVFCCVESNLRRSEQLRQTLGHLGDRAIVVRKDFLKWKPSDQFARGFECVVMNPPFSAVKSSWIQWSNDSTLTALREVPSKMPIEVGFLLKSVEHLAPGGRLISIVPSSIVAGEQFVYVREILQCIGNISTVHELPKFSFRGIESGFFVLAFDKTGVQSFKTSLLNRNLAQPVGLEPTSAEIGSSIRLDFSHVSAKRQYDELIEKNPSCEWVELGKVATVVRGFVSAPFDKHSCIHSSQFENGFWFTPFAMRRTGGNAPVLRWGDLAVCRVGRNASQRFGVFRESRGGPFSDCVLRIRVRRISSLQCLFWLRAIFQRGQFSKLLERGTGATYLTVRDLRRVLIPTKLPPKADDLLGGYEESVASRDFSQMLALERQLLELFERGA